MRIIVTGASGFIGSHVVSAAVAAGHRVIALRRRGTTNVVSDDGVKWIVGDLQHGASIEVTARIDALIHCAGLLPGIARGPNAARGRGSQLESSALGVTLGAIELATRLRVGRFVHLSSLAVHDPPAAGGRLDEHSPLAGRIPRWNRYARLKIAEERAVRAAANKLSVVFLRPGVVLGPGDRHATPAILAALSARWPVPVGRGANIVPCVAVLDLADAAVRAAERPGIEGQPYPIASRESLTQRALLALHARAAGWPFPGRALPRPVASALAAIGEWIAPAHAPITRVGVWIAGTHCPVSCARAAADLGWSGSASVSDTIACSVADALGRRHEEERS